MKHQWFIPYKLLVIIFIICQGCSKKGTVGAIFPSSPESPSQVLSDTVVKRYLALGDSYTIGEGVTEPERYPAQAVAILTSQGMKFLPVKYIAQTGWTTINLEAAIAYQNLTTTFDIVTLLIGVNDQYQKNDTTGYRSNFTRLLETSVKLAGYRSSRVIVLSIPDYGVTTFGAGWPNVGIQIDAFNAINKSVTDSWKIAYLDITEISRKAANVTGLILGGGPHFTGTEYGLWASPLSVLMGSALK